MKKKKRKADFNKNHPERMPDEVFITNADDEIDEMGFDKFDLGGGESSWESVGWKTKRRGQIAYDIHGRSLGNRWPGSFPVFAKQAEIKAKSEETLRRLLPDGVNTARKRRK